MSSASDIIAVSPAPPALMLELAGNMPRFRRALLRQRLMGHSIGYMTADGTALAAAMLCQIENHARQWEFALAVAPAAGPFMLKLTRIAHLTLRSIAETGVLVFARVDPGNQAGKRMARLVGFRPGRMADPAIWIWR